MQIEQIENVHGCGRILMGSCDKNVSGKFSGRGCGFGRGVHFVVSERTTGCDRVRKLLIGLTPASGRKTGKCAAIVAVKRVCISLMRENCCRQRKGSSETEVEVVRAPQN